MTLETASPMQPGRQLSFLEKHLIVFVEKRYAGVKEALIESGTWKPVPACQTIGGKVNCSTSLLNGINVLRLLPAIKKESQECALARVAAGQDINPETDNAYREMLFVVGALAILPKKFLKKNGRSIFRTMKTGLLLLGIGLSFANFEGYMNSFNLEQSENGNPG